MRVTFHGEARVEFLAAVRRYNAEETGLGSKFIQAVADSIQRIRDYPASYVQILANFRRAGVRKFPYGLVYMVYDGGVKIVAVMHNRQRPDYFTERI